MKQYLFFTALTILLFNIQLIHLDAQQTVECGDIIESEFINLQENQDYKISVSAGDSLSLYVRPLGTDLTLVALLYNPTGTQVAGPTGYYRTSSEYLLESGILGANGEYTIRVANHDWSDSNSGTGGVGVYTLEISCTLRDGTEIEAGVIPDASSDSTSQTATAADSAFSGFGFPGLSPVDFSEIARLPLSSGTPMGGAITPSGSEIIGYQFDAEAGDTVDLAFNRLSGNLNLGLVVIDEESNVVYQASLVTTQSMSAQFTVPNTSTYTAGIFRIDLLPPDTPEATGFQVTATINP